MAISVETVHSSKDQVNNFPSFLSVKADVHKKHIFFLNFLLPFCFTAGQKLILVQPRLPIEIRKLNSIDFVKRATYASERSSWNFLHVYTVDPVLR